MKRFYQNFLLIFALTLCVNIQAQAANNTLVAYYSFTGNVSAIVNALQQQFSADVIQIEPAEEGLDYAANNYALGSSLISAIRNNPNDASSYPAIKPVSVDLSRYDNIIVATPLWWSQMAAPMQTFLFHNGSEMAGKNIGLIVSSASSGISSVVADAKRLIPGGNFLEPNLWIKSAQTSNAASLVSEWLAAINLPTSSNQETETMQINVGSYVFNATLEDNATASAFKELLPLTVTMNELNGNEKYHYLNTTLPTAAGNPGTIQAGDIMLYGNNCIVVFYETFSSGYSYTRIGHISDTAQLKQALGTGNVAVNFSLPAVMGKKGDINNDGSVNVSDVTYLINIILGIISL